MKHRKPEPGRGVSVVPSAEGQRAAYDVPDAGTATRLVAQSHAAAERLIASLGPRRHKHTWTYHPRSIGGWGVAECTTCGKEDIY